MPSEAPQVPARQHRDTDPLAVWGFVLALVFWPVGIVISYAALRRIRRTAAGGWGLAAAGAALSTIAAIVVGIGGLYYLAVSGLPDAWTRGSSAAATERNVRSVGDQVYDEILRTHDDTGTWPSSIRLLDLPIAADGTVRSVEVEGYRAGEEICVEAASTGSGSGFWGSLMGGDFEDEVSCADRGAPDTLRAVTFRENQAATQAEADDALAQVLERGAAVAAGSRMDEQRDLGIRGVPEVDLMACSLIAGNRQQLDDMATREALADAFSERADTVADGGLDNAASFLREIADADDGGYDAWVLRAEFDCWSGGYAPPGEPLVFPSLWTTPLTEEEVALGNERAQRFADGTQTPDDVATEDARQAQEQGEVEASITANLER